MVRIEDFSFIQAQRFDNILIRMGMNGFLECLAQQILAALRIGDMPVSAQHDIIRCQ